MTDIILQIIMIGGAGFAGYSLHALRNPQPKRGPNGRFTKK